MLEQRPVALERLLQVGRLVRVPQPAPGNEVRTGRHHGRRVELQERQPVDDRAQVTWPVGVEQLCPDRDPARLGAVQSTDVRGHSAV